METKITFREPKNLKKEPASGRKIDICMVSTITMTKLCKDPGTSTFVISMTDLNLSQVTATEILDSILAKYHEFRDIFSGERSEEHTSELQSHLNLVCRLLLEKKKKKKNK